MRIVRYVEQLLSAITGKPDVFRLPVRKEMVGLFVSIAGSVLSVRELPIEACPFPTQDGCQAAAVDRIRDVTACQLQYGRHDILMTYGVVAHNSFLHIRTPNKQWDASGSIVWETLSEQIVVAKHFPVVAGDNDKA